MEPRLSALIIGVALAACGGSTPNKLTEAGTNPTTDGDSGPVVNDVLCPPLAMPAVTATVHVDASGSGAETGTKDAPYRTLAQAFGSVGANGIIWVAAGTYSENVVVPDKNLVLQGGFTSGFGSRTDGCATVIQAATGAEPVFTASSSVRSFTLEGMTIQKGSRGLSVEGDDSVQATFTITSSVFSDNGTVDAVGGGVYVVGVNAVVTRSVFHDNRAAKGAGLASTGNVTLTIEDSVFVRNVGHSDHGGAVYASPSRGTIRRNTFRRNEIGKALGYGWGGAVDVFRAGASPVDVALASNVFTDNLAGVGGAIFVDEGASVTMSHDLIYRNRAMAEEGVVRGAAIYVDGSEDLGSTLVADHVTIVDNVYDATGTRATLTQGGVVFVERSSKATFTNSILWNNGTDALFGDGSAEIAVRYSVAPGQCVGAATCTIGEGVFEPENVLFVDEAGNDFHDKSTAGHFHNGAFEIDTVTSPTLDRADPAASFSSEPAPNGGRANLGAYGGTAEASKSP